MIEEGGPIPASLSAAASSSPSASQENDQAQANSAVDPSGFISTKPQNGMHARQYAAGCGGRRRGGGGGVRGTFLRGRSKNRPSQGVGSGASGAALCSKFVSPEAVLSAARQVKDSLPQLSPELLTSLKARGLEPCTLKEVLEERGIDWAATQVRSSPHNYAAQYPLPPLFIRSSIGGF